MFYLLQLLFMPVLLFDIFMSLWTHCPSQYSIKFNCYYLQNGNAYGSFIYTISNYGFNHMGSNKEIQQWLKTTKAYSLYFKPVVIEDCFEH